MSIPSVSLAEFAWLAKELNKGFLLDISGELLKTHKVGQSSENLSSLVVLVCSLDATLTAALHVLPP